MIYYFSATGNSAWVAQKLALQTGDKAIDMRDFLKTGETARSPADGERLGLVFPVHAWRPPRCVLDFVKTLQVPRDSFVYAVCTMGETAGNAIAFLQKVLRINSAYSVQMPNNYILLGDRDSDLRITRKLSAAEKRIAEISEAVLAGREEFQIKRGMLPGFLTGVVGALFNKYCRDRKFVAEHSCSNCGLCERLCPMNNIILENGKPAWQGHCIHCMACLQNCPEKAIQYGGITKKRQRYVFPAGSTDSQSCSR
ncbi:MAG: hypothetical protein GX927_05120 [Lentisphaerae bacterium]|jgi:NAD-dependent dihydropyrimidine dehydrogenase PreA subunit|nr:hypothetical protein [Lentisphaerota bacterium]